MSDDETTRILSRKSKLGNVDLTQTSPMAGHVKDSRSQAEDEHTRIYRPKSKSTTTESKSIGETVEKTGRVVVVQEAQRTAGIAANVMAEISERFVLSLKAPIGRVAGPDSIFPFAQAENDWAIKADDIVKKVKEVVDYD